LDDLLDIDAMNKQVMDCDMKERDEGDDPDTVNHCLINVIWKSGKAPTDSKCGEKSMIFV